MEHVTIRVRTGESECVGLPNEPYRWDYSVYGNVKEPLGKYVTATRYVDANLFHAILSNIAVTRTLHLINKTPIDWYSKK